MCAQCSKVIKPSESHHSAGAPKGQAFDSLPRVNALNVGWVVCSSLASRSTKAAATVDLLAALSLSCLRPECYEEGAGGSLPAGAPVCQPWREQPSVDRYCLALIHSLRHFR